VAKALPVTEVLVVHLVSSPLPCAVFSLEPLAQDPGNEIMDLSRVNRFIPLPLPRSPLPGSKTGLIEDTLVWSSEQFTFSKLRLELVTKFCSGEYSGAAKGFRNGSVCCTCVAGSRSMYCLGTDIYIYIYIYILYHEARPKYMDLFCK
jgi:hypothetical protein